MCNFIIFITENCHPFLPFYSSFPSFLPFLPSIFSFFIPFCCCQLSKLVSYSFSSKWPFKLFCQILKILNFPHSLSNELNIQVDSNFFPFHLHEKNCQPLFYKIQNHGTQQITWHIVSVQQMLAPLLPTSLLEKKFSLFF